MKPNFLHNIPNARRRPIPASRGAPSEDSALSEGEVDDPDLLNVLTRLLTALEPSHAGDRILGAGGSAKTERWEDQDYIYVEANINGAFESLIDICIVNDLVFIRIAR